MTSPRKKVKKVRAWAILDKDGEIIEGSSLRIHIEKGRAIADKIMQEGKKIIPCTISFTIPSKKKR